MPNRHALGRRGVVFTNHHAVLTPPAGTPNDARNRRAVDLFLELGLKRINPTATLMWISDPDTTAHEYGVGHPSTMAAVKRVDGEIKRLEDGPFINEF